MPKHNSEFQGEKVERTFFPNGALKSEVTYVGENIHGTTRMWHENGQLKSEVPMVQSKLHGTAREWNSNGELLGESEFVNGTGLHQSWFESGCLRSECYMLNGIPNGRLRSWDEDGVLLIEAYVLASRKVSKKKYLEAGAKNDSLPRYEEDSLRPALMEDDNAPRRTVNSSMSLADYPDAQDAVKWLAASNDESPRNLGELPPGKKSKSLLERFIKHGAAKVYVVNVKTDNDGSMNTGHILVELPSDSQARKRILNFVNQMNSSLGFDAEDNGEQEFVLVALD